MKYSLYNNSVHYDDKVIIHNGMSNKFLVLENELFSLLEAAVKEEAILELKKIHPDFYDEIEKQGFIVKREKDELQACLEKANNVIYNDEFFELQINPTMNCNFKCWYCYETHIKSSKISPETHQNIIKLVNNVLGKQTNLKKFKLNWFGGEPLLYFDQAVHPILKEVYELVTAKGIEFVSVFTSNGLLINEKIAEVCAKYNVKTFQITLDGHRNRHNQVRYVSKTRGSYDDIIRNIKLILEYDIYVNVRINCSEETLNGLENIIEDFVDVPVEKRKKLFFDFHDVWQNEKALADSELKYYMDLFRNNNFNVYSLSLNTFNSMCYADKENMVNINYNGDLFKCTARDFTGENSEGILTDKGELVWNEKHEKRLNSKYKNQPCLECSYLPVCGGGCSQIALESEEEFCIYDFDENKKQQIILDNFLGHLSNDEIEVLT